MDGKAKAALLEAVRLAEVAALAAWTVAHRAESGATRAALPVVCGVEKVLERVEGLLDEAYDAVAGL